MIRHPNIIQLYEIIETPKQLYLIMEYANGGELFDYIVKHGKVTRWTLWKMSSGIKYNIEFHLSVYRYKCLSVGCSLN